MSHAKTRRRKNLFRESINYSKNSILLINSFQETWTQFLMNLKGGINDLFGNAILFHYFFCVFAALRETNEIK